MLVLILVLGPHDRAPVSLFRFLLLLLSAPEFRCSLFVSQGIMRRTGENKKSHVCHQFHMPAPWLSYRQRALPRLPLMRAGRRHQPPLAGFNGQKHQKPATELTQIDTVIWLNGESGCRCYHWRRPSELPMWRRGFIYVRIVALLPFDISIGRD